MVVHIRKKNFVLQRSYRDKDDNWNNVNNFRIKDITKIEVVFKRIKRILFT